MWLAAAYELNDFKAIACHYLGCVPLSFGEDFEVVLNGNAAGVEAEVVEKGTHAGAGRQLLRFTVYLDVDFVRHVLIIPRERGVSHATKSGVARWLCLRPRG
jgi:hypothetical protein